MFPNAAVARDLGTCGNSLAEWQPHVLLSIFTGLSLGGNCAVPIYLSTISTISIITDTETMLFQSKFHFLNVTIAVFVRFIRRPGLRLSEAERFFFFRILLAVIANE